MDIHPVYLFLISFAGLCLSLDSQHSSSLYCFVNPDSRTDFDPTLLQNTTCTHYVFGDYLIDNGEIKYSNRDLVFSGRNGNIRNFLKLRYIHRKSKFLLGVRRNKQFDDSLNAVKIGRYLSKEYQKRSFDGIFVKFGGHHLEQHSSAVFIKELSSNKTLPTIALTSNYIWNKKTTDRLLQLSPSIDHIYIDMSTLPSNEDVQTVTHVDPLFANGTIPFEDTIEGTIDRLMEQGVSTRQIVIGLTAGGWEYMVPRVLTIYHGDYATTSRRRVAYQEACRARGTIMFDNRTLNEVTVFRHSWMSSNIPSNEGLAKKIHWILGHHVAGIGIDSIYNDDPHAQCGGYPLPSHALAQNIIDNTLESIPAKCTRICYLSSDKIDESFPFDSLQSEYCSHVIIDYFDLDLQKMINVREESSILMQRVEKWRKMIGEEAAPKLILSLGARQLSHVWTPMLANRIGVKQLVNDLRKAVQDIKADGIEISWTQDHLNSDLDKNNLNNFVTELNEENKKSKIDIVLGATAESTFSNWYDIKFLNKTVDLVVLYTHRLHSDKKPFTGHPSPLFATSSMTDQKMCLSAVVKEWLLMGIEPSKLAVSISAEALSMSYLADQKSFDEPFGKPTFGHWLRASSQAIDTQKEVCEAIKVGSAIPEWSETAKVPYLIKNDQIIAYENIQSTHIKAVWSSIKGIGMALHDINADDPFGICDNRTKFPLLHEMTKAQMPIQTLKQYDFKKCEHDFAVFCSFDLKSSIPKFKSNVVPYEKCTHIMVEQAKLTKNGTIKYDSDDQEESVKELAEMRDKMLKSGMILSLNCGSSETSFTSMLLENMTTIVDNLADHLQKYKFSGIQFDCENVVRRNNNIQFNNLIRRLHARLSNSKAANGCGMTVSVRFSHKTATPHQFYQIALLNKLDFISLATRDQYFNDLPMFNSTTPSMERITKNWMSSGIKPSKIIIEISPYGKQINNNNGDIRTITRGQSCEIAGNRAHYELDYLNLASVWSQKSSTIHLPSHPFVLYKIGLAHREKLAGISIRSLNGDDYVGICGRGSFPLLKSLYSNVRLIKAS